MLKRSIVLTLILVACGGTATAAPEDVGGSPDLPATTAEEFEAHIGGIDRPAVVNVLASWCLP